MEPRKDERSSKVAVEYHLKNRELQISDGELIFKSAIRNRQSAIKKMVSYPNNKDPQWDILEGYGAFGVDYVPKKNRAKVIDGRVYGGKISEFTPGKAKAIPLDRFTIALFRVDDEFYALKDACPHADYPLSKSQLISKYVVMCTSHNWQFDIRDGHCVKIGKCGKSVPDLEVRTFPVEIKGEDVWVVVSTDTLNIRKV